MASEKQVVVAERADRRAVTANRIAALALAIAIIAATVTAWPIIFPPH